MSPAVIGEGGYCRPAEACNARVRTVDTQPDVTEEDHKRGLEQCYSVLTVADSAAALTDGHSIEKMSIKKN